MEMVVRWCGNHASPFCDALLGVECGCEGYVWELILARRTMDGCRKILMR